MARELTIMEMVKELRRRYNCGIAVIEGRFGLYFYKFEDLESTQVRNLYNKSKSHIKYWSITPVVLDLVGPGTYEGSAILITKDKPCSFIFSYNIFWSDKDHVYYLTDKLVKEVQNVVDY